MAAVTICSDFGAQIQSEQANLIEQGWLRYWQFHRTDLRVKSGFGVSTLLTSVCVCVCVCVCARARAQLQPIVFNI